MPKETTDLPGYTTWTTNATTTGGEGILGIDAVFTGPMNQINPFGSSTIFQDNNFILGFLELSVDQDSQFSFTSHADLLLVKQEENGSLLNAAFAITSEGDTGASSVDFAQIVIPNGATVNYSIEFNDGRGIAIPISGSITGTAVED